MNNVLIIRNGFILYSSFGVAAVRFLRGTFFAEVRLGITDLRVKSAVRQKRHYALFAAIRMKPNYALFSL